ncbi:hypothetical protein ACFVGY_15725 [Streptomyces sp. NPDC127106]|uniref:hypothetical protein n=1 Tax=Streptomyces sp. NPDC127106 TaxID=3345360 RepID=UPI00363C8CA8
MHLERLRAIVTEHTEGGTLTLPADRLGTGPAADLIHTWWDGTLTVGGLSRQDPKNGPIRISGRAGLLKVDDRPVSGVEFGITDGAPTLLFPFPLPVAWTWATSFPKLAGSGLNALAWQAEPVLFLTSHPRQATQGRPKLAPGLTFHSPQTKLPHHLTDLAELLGISGAVFGLTGTVAKTADDPQIQLRSPGRELGALGASFHLWGGSRPEGRYELRLGAELRIDTRTGVVLSAPADGLAKTVTLRADALPAEVTAGSLAKWDGTGEAAGRITGKGFALGKTVRLTEVSLDLDPAELKKGPGAAVSALRVKLTAGPDAGWKLAGGVLTLSRVGAEFTVERPLAKSNPPRNATARGTARLDLYDVAALTAEASFPPGTFTLKLPDDEPIRLKQAVERLCPGAQVNSLPELTVSKLDATADKDGLSLDAVVEGEWKFGVGPAWMTLTEAKLSLARGKPQGKEPSDGGRKVSGELTAKATLGINGSRGEVALDARVALPGTFGLKGEFKDLTVDKLLRALTEQADIPLPGGFPEITLPEARAELTVGKGAGGGSSSSGTPTAYDLVLDAKAVIGKNTSFRCIGRAGRDSAGKALFAAALWTDKPWSPAEVAVWNEGLKEALSGITFTRAGFAFATRDGVKPGGEKLPAALPEELSKGVTLFTEVRLTGVLKPVAELFDDKGGLALRAHLAGEIARSEFVLEAPRSRIQGMGALTLTLKPAELTAALFTQLTFSVKNTDGSTHQLLLTAGGRLSLGKQEFSLFLVLQGGTGSTAGTAELLAYALDSPVSYALPSTYGRLIEPGVRQAGAELVALSEPPTTSPAWHDAFGVKGLDVDAFYVQVDVGAQSGLGIGMGGRIRLGGARLALDAHGGFKGAPYIDVFRFSLDTATGDEDRGVTLWEILVQLAPEAHHADWLKPLLNGIRLYQLVVVFVAKGTTWQSPPPLKESWDPGFSTKGHVNLFGIDWRFELSVAPTGIHAFSSMDKPIVLGDVLTISSADGRKGPSYQLDTRSITDGSPARKTLLHLDARVRLLGADIAAKIDLGASGWTFQLAASIHSVLKTAVSCTLDDKGLTATAGLSLNFVVDLPTAIGPLPKGKIGVALDASVTLAVTTTSCTAALHAKCQAFFGPASIDFHLNAGFGVASWADFEKYLKANPDVLFAEVGKGIWQKIENCALKTAAGKL